MRRIFVWWLVVCTFGTMVQGQETRVLIVDGVSNHDWRTRIDVIRHILGKDAGLDVHVSVTPDTVGDSAWDTWWPNFKNYDVVLSCYSDYAPIMGPAKPRWPAEVEKDLEEFVSGGGGLFVFHEGNNAFKDWGEWNKMIGMGWRDDASSGSAVFVNADESLQIVPPGVEGGTSHGSRANVEVKRRVDDHPIYNGLGDSWMAAGLEVYRHARGPLENFEVLTYAQDPQGPNQWPIEWTTTYGEGNVYVMTYGHMWEGDVEPNEMRCSAFQALMIRAIKWLGGDASPDAPMDGDFPSPTQISLQPWGTEHAGLDSAAPAVAFNGVLPTASEPPGAMVVNEAFTNFQWNSPTIAEPWPLEPGKVIINEIDGRLFVLDDDDSTTTREKVLDIQERCWEQHWISGNPGTVHGGLQNLVFHPQFGQGQGKDHIYVQYMHHPTDDPNSHDPYYLRISRFTWNGPARQFENELIMIQQYDVAKGHDGGGMAFGADGFLYIGVGDEGTQDAASTPHSQITDRFRSGVWRIDVDMQGGSISHPIRKSLPAEKHTIAGNYLAGTTSGNITTGYYIPSDNPWVDDDGQNIEHLEEFYAIGLRQPHRMSFDPVTGWFWIGDVGGNRWEEIDVIDAPGLNFQWNYKQGNEDAPRNGGKPNPVLGIERGPFFEYAYNGAACVIGGFVYRGNGAPGIHGKYIFGDNATQRIYAAEFSPISGAVGSVEQIAQAGTGNLWNGISSFGTDSSGEILVTRVGAGQPGGGKIYRLSPDPGTPDLSQFPLTLSATGLFSDTPNLVPIAGMIPFSVNMPLWSDGMVKTRWMMVPNDGNPNSVSEQILYSEEGNWGFPVGSVLVKNFARPDTGENIETRVMVRANDGDWAFTTYRWRADGSDADLLENGEDIPMTIDGQSFIFRIPARNQCTICHTDNAGQVLGPRTRQLNGNQLYPTTGRRANQVETLSRLGLIAPALDQVDLAQVVTSANATMPATPYEDYARSYLDSNCMHCHQPGGTRAGFDLRLFKPLNQQNLVCGSIHNPLDLDEPFAIKPGDVFNSMVFHRISSTDGCCAMPPLGKGIVDAEAISQLGSWIASMEASDCSVNVGDVTTQLGNTAGSASVTDGYVKNFIVNTSDSFTNNTGGDLIIGLSLFRFTAGRVTDPITPVVLRADGGNSFTIRAIGTQRANYQVGVNTFSFSDVPRTLTLADGETIVPGFIDFTTGGSNEPGAGAVAYNGGGDSVYQVGIPPNENRGWSGFVEGSAPEFGYDPPFWTFLFGNPWQTHNFNRDYQFNITFSIAGNDPDSDGDDLNDSWEKYYVSDLGILSSSGDFDEDGFTDDEERRLGTDPTDPGSLHKTIAVVPTVDGHIVEASIRTFPGRRYRLLLSTNLGDAWVDKGIVEAAPWPALETSVMVDVSDLPIEHLDRVYLLSEFVD